MSQAANTFKNTAHSTFGVWLEFFLGMLASIIIARTLTPSTYGQYSFMMWSASVFVIAANGGLTTAVIKFMAAAPDDQQKAAVRNFIRGLQHRFLLGMVTVAIALAAIEPGLFSDSASWITWSVLLLAAVIKAAYIVEMSASKGREDFAAISRVVMLVGPLNILFCVSAAVWQPSLSGFIAVYAMTSAAYLIAMRVFSGSHSDGEALSREKRQQIWRHIRITSGSILLSFMILKQSEVLFLKLLRPAEEIGFFNIAFTLGFALSALIPGAYSALLLPMMSRQSSSDKDGQRHRLTNAIRYLLALSVPMAAGTWVLGPSLVQLLYGQAYAQAGEVLMWIIGGVAIAAIGQAAVSQLVSTDRQQQVLAINLIVTVLVLALDWWAISNFGLAGAGPAFLAGNLMHAGGMLALALRQARARWPLGATIRIVCASGLSALMTVATIRLIEDWPTLVILLAGGAVFVVMYAPCTWFIGVWNPDERTFIRKLIKRPGEPR